MSRMLMSRLSPWLLVAGLAGLVGGCSPTYPDCDNDEHCKEKSEYCVNQKCQQCRETSHCETCQQCAAGRCEVIEGCCQTDGDCSLGQKCRDGQCGPECLETSDCAPGNKCSSGRCAPDVDCVSPSDCADGKTCEAGRCVEPPPPAEPVRECSLEVILFDFDSFEIRAEAQPLLEANAQCVRAKGGARVRVEGHCDDRGTEEYNLALGERRARAAKNYLERLGISGIEVVSYGENQPADTGRGEDSRALNRRAEIVVP